MRVALCHLNVICGPQTVNLCQLEQAIRMAAQQGAQWVLTPEMAVQGYHFLYLGQNQVMVPQPAPELRRLLDIVRAGRMYLFLGCGERDPQRQQNYDSCLVFGPDGRLCGRHRKMTTHHFGAEAWAARGSGDTLVPVTCGTVPAGLLVCADAWYVEYARRLQQQGARVLTDLAAWTATRLCGNPLPAWERCSAATGLPVFVCNQTGVSPRMDLTQAQSAVISGGSARLLYQGKPAVLLFDWNEGNGMVVSRQFEVIPFPETEEVSKRGDCQRGRKNNYTA